MREGRKIYHELKERYARERLEKYEERRKKSMKKEEREVWNEYEKIVKYGKTYECLERKGWRRKKKVKKRREMKENEGKKKVKEAKKETLTLIALSLDLGHFHISFLSDIVVTNTSCYSITRNHHHSCATLLLYTLKGGEKTMKERSKRSR